MASGTGEEIRIGGLTIRYVLEGAASGGPVAMFEFDVEAQAAVPAAHSHDAYEETIYGLGGVLTFTVEGRRVEIRPGDALCIPRGAVHRFENFHAEKARLLAVITPGISGPDYFREIAAILKAAAGGAPDLAAIGMVMRRHGLTPAPQGSGPAAVQPSVAARS